ncbi:MAG TPA: RluA family pseudouridine synthase, partial [Vicinamibacterales bacterium]|nr:RluA family pseudouridine synthase [Vicinamibacterales bacterium]
MKTWTVAEAEAGARVDAWLAARPEIGSRGRARTAIERGKVFINGDPLDYTNAGTRVAAGDEVGYWEDRPGSARTADRDLVSARPSLHVVFEDAVLLAVDKPPGWLVEPLPGQERSEVTLLDLVRDHLRASARRPSVVHRIDRDTSGLVLFATTPAARDHLKEQFERRTPERLYVAVVHGLVSPPSGTWRDHLVWD